MRQDTKQGKLYLAHGQLNLCSTINTYLSRVFMSGFYRYNSWIIVHIVKQGKEKSKRCMHCCIALVDCYVSEIEVIKVKR